MEEEAVTDLAAGVEDTLLSVVVGTDSVVVTHLADSPGRGFSPGFSGTRGFSTARFSGRGDHDRFGDRGFRGRDRDFRDRRFRDFDGNFFDFGVGGFGYPDYSYYYPYSYDNNNGYLSVERAVQEELAELGYYHGPADGTIGPETQRAIRWFQSVAKIPITGRIDSALLRALQIS
jgi:hypothetical protein